MRGFGDPILMLHGLSLPGSTDDVTYGQVDKRLRTREMPYTDQPGYVIRSLGDFGEEAAAPWYTHPLAAAGLGFTAGALLCALLKR